MQALFRGIARLFAVLVGISRTASRRATARRQTISSHTRCHDVLQSECQKQGPGPGRSSQYIQQCAVASDASATLDPNSALFLRRLERPRRIRDPLPPWLGRGGRAPEAPAEGPTLEARCRRPVFTRFCFTIHSRAGRAPTFFSIF